MAVVMLNKGNTSSHNNNMNSGHLQNQLTRSLERILEDAHLSGELKLSGRKLKDFPKAAGKYNLSDTVIADLSRNRFCELPEDITSFAFLETLLAYHNAIKIIPETVRGLQSLTYLDLRNNQLSTLPREICFLPLQVLLLSNNRLVSLPEELGRMDNLSELDAACNQITHLPIRIGDLVSLKSLSLRNNQLVFLPRELTCLQLVTLDISCNRIAALPVELRLMTTLVDLELDNNPLTSPPASLCVRGLVHVFKFLETVALKEEKTNSFNGATLRRQQIGARHSTNSLPEQKLNNRRQHVDSGYSTSDGGIDKRWLPDDNPSKYSPTPIHIRTDICMAGTANNILNLSPNSCNNVIPPAESHIMLIDEECKRTSLPEQKCSSNNSNNKSGYSSQSNSTDVSPEGDNIDGHDKNRTLGGIQTYREYKEALRQQRNQDSSSIYRTKDQITPPDGESPSSNPNSTKSQTSTPSPTIFSSNQCSPMSPHHQSLLNANKLNGNGLSSNDVSPIHTLNRNSINARNLNGNQMEPLQNGKSNGVYIKPSSPLKTTGILSHNNIPTTGGGGGGLRKTSNGVGKATDQKPTNRVSWNRDVPGDKMTFTMRREIDKQKEESELIDQLRTIIESRLKMQLPEDIASALTDGVVLCYLANHVRPRSVASIHVPSPGVPKLTMARCRKNVDNFLEACRKIGVDEELICSCGDIVPSDEGPTNPPNPTLMYRTIYALVQHHHTQYTNRGENLDGGDEREEDEDVVHHHHNNLSIMSSYGQECMVTATNTNYTSQECDNDYDNYFKNIGIHFSKAPPATTTNLFIKNNSNLNNNNNNNNIDSNTNCNDYDDDDEYVDDDDIIINPKNINNNNDSSNYTQIKPHSLDLSQKPKKLSKNKKNFYDNFQLNGITEECEYDSDIGKFNCKTASELDMNSSERSSVSTPGPNSIDYSSIIINNNNNSDIIIINNYATGNHIKRADHFINDLNTPNQYADYDDGGGSDIDNLNIEANKIVSKRIEFFENNLMNGSNDNSNKIINKINKQQSHNIINDYNNNYSSILLLTIFFTTLIGLYLFPLPN